MNNKRNITIAIAITIVMFIVDIRTPVGYADWLLYFIPFFMAAAALRRTYIPFLALIATLLIIATQFLSPPGGNPMRSAANRAMGILVLWWSTFIIMKRKHAEEALARSYHELEQRVEDRTAELNRVNASLESEIAERRHAEQTLRESETRLYGIASTALDAVILIDNDGNVSFWNEAAVRMFGFTSEEIVGKCLHSYIMPERHVDRFQKGFETFRITGGGPFVGTVYEIEAKRKDGTEFPAELSLNSLKLKGRWNAIGIVRDITGRRQAEELLKKTMDELERSNKDLEQFGYAVSHDLQEPLRTVASYVKLLTEKYRGKLDERADKYISFAIDGATRMAALIADLLAYSRVGGRGKQFAAVQMSAAFKTAVGNLSKAAEEASAVITADRLPKVCGDETQLVQLFQNLIGNAIKFRKKDVQARIHISAERKGDQWLFGAHDNGIGIEPGFQERVFTIFQRLHTREEYPGTGIGLAVCRKIVERHGGRIWVESEPGEGSTFYFTLSSTTYYISRVREERAA